MKLTIFLVIAWFTTTISLGNVDEPLFRVIRTSTDEQIREIEQQVLQQYGDRVEVKVITRNSKGEITNLHFVRYNKAGKEKSSCSSENFSQLIIRKDGSTIEVFKSQN